jgi:hypothetical protein
VCGRNLMTGLTSAASPRMDISSTCKVGQKLGLSLPLLTWSPSVWPSRLLYRRGRKSRRDLWITLYFHYQQGNECKILIFYLQNILMCLGLPELCITIVSILLDITDIAWSINNLQYFGTFMCICHPPVGNLLQSTARRLS